MFFFEGVRSSDSITASEVDSGADDVEVGLSIVVDVDCAYVTAVDSDAAISNKYFIVSPVYKNYPFFSHNT
jgi:hypothetical protein